MLMSIMAGMVAFAIDCGMMALAREQLQVAADCAALAGADALVTGPAAAVITAQNFAQANTAGGTAVVVDPSQDIQLGTWDKNALTFTALSGTSQGSANAVRVTCHMSQARGNPLKLFFAPIFGKTTADLSAVSVAFGSNVVCGPFVGLNLADLTDGYTDSYDATQGAYSRTSAWSNGNICSNGAVWLNGAGTVVNGSAHPGIGNSVTESGGAYATGTTTALTQTLTEPSINVGNAATVNNNINIPLSTKGNKPLDSSGNFSLVSGDSVSLPPGTYYFSSLTLPLSATVTISGKTIIYCTGNFEVLQGGIVNSTQLPVNCQIYCLGPLVALENSSSFFGVLYAPSAVVGVIGGSGDFYGMIVAAWLGMIGGGYHYDESLAALTGAQLSAQLVQ